MYKTKVIFAFVNSSNNTEECEKKCPFFLSPFFRSREYH